MLAYQSYNVKSPLNGEAARWVEKNKDRFPLDPVSLLPEDERPIAAQEPGPATAAKQANSAVATPRPAHGETFDVVCGVCQTAYRVKTELKGKKIRCKRCQTVFKI